MGQRSHPAEPLTTALGELGGRITSWPRCMEERYGYTSGQALGQRPTELLRTVFLRPRGEIAAALTDTGIGTADVINYDIAGDAVITVTHWELRPGAEGQPAHIAETHADPMPQALALAQTFAAKVATIAHDLGEALTSVSVYNFGMQTILQRMSPKPETLPTISFRQASQINRAAASLKLLRDVTRIYRLTSDAVAPETAAASPSASADIEVLQARTDWFDVHEQIKAIVNIPETEIRHIERDALLSPLFERQHAIIGRLCDMRTHGAGGLSARAEIILSMDGEIEDAGADGKSDRNDQARLVMSLLLDLVALPPATLG